MIWIHRRTTLGANPLWLHGFYNPAKIMLAGLCHQPLTHGTHWPASRDESWSLCISKIFQLIKVRWHLRENTMSATVKMESIWRDSGLKYVQLLYISFLRPENATRSCFHLSTLSVEYVSIHPEKVHAHLPEAAEALRATQWLTHSNGPSTEP